MSAGGRSVIRLQFITKYSLLIKRLSFMHGFMHLEQTYFFFISMGDMWIRRFFSKYMLRMGDIPGNDLQGTLD